MNYLDIILAIPLLYAVYRGFTKGFIIALASLIALVGGIYGAIHFSALAGEYIYQWFTPKPEYSKLIAFAVTFLVIIAAVYLIAHLIDKFIKATGLGLINRLAGVVFNFVKMALIISVIMNLFNYAGMDKPLIPEKIKQESVLYGPVSAIAPAIFHNFRLKDIREKIKEKEDPIKKVITHSIRP